MGEMEVGVPQEEIAAKVTEISETISDLAQPAGVGVYGVVVPAAESATTGTAHPQFSNTSCTIAGTDFGVHSRAGCPASGMPPG
jgi:hypothetical protein